MKTKGRWPQEDAIYQGFGAMVRAGRQKQGLTQGQLATSIGVSNVWVCEVEKGVARVTLGDAVNLSSILNLPLKRLIKGVMSEQG